MTPAAGDEVRTYYGRPVVKEPVWKWMIPAYFSTGGLAAGSALFALGARRAGDPRASARMQLVSLGATAASGALLVADLGRPDRFYNMLRVAKVTSPMSVGSWLLVGFAPSTGVSALAQLAGVLPRLAGASQAAAALLAPAVATYTAVLVADTAIPAWHEARGELPYVFAGSAAASTAGAALVVLPSASASASAGVGAARRLAVVAAVVGLAADTAMERRLGPLGAPYRAGEASRLRQAARWLTASGAVLAAVGARRRRVPAVLAGTALLAGSVIERFAVVRAGVESARDPTATIAPQRARVEAATGDRTGANPAH